VLSLFDRAGNWLRCALQAHTTKSEGALPPEMLARHYEWAGLDVLAIADHWVQTVEPSTEGLFVIAGAELDARIDGHSDAHVLALGIGEDPVLPDAEGGRAWTNTVWVG
jgi:predicted metal-dependent phosphoesterase TrpH